MDTKKMMDGWFVVEVKYNRGATVKKILERIISSRNLQNQIFRVALPSKRGINTYILVNMINDASLFSMIKSLNHVKRLLIDEEPYPLGVVDALAIL